MPNTPPGLGANPFFNNGLVLDLIAWNIISVARAGALFANPRLEARKLTRSADESVIENKVQEWAREYSESGCRVAVRWPHPIYPPLTEGFSDRDL